MGIVRYRDFGRDGWPYRFFNRRFLFSALVLLVCQTGWLSAAEGTAPHAELTFEQIDGFRHEKKWTEILAALGEGDLSTKAGALGTNLDQVYYLRGQAHAALKEGEAAEADYKLALESAQEKDPRRQEYLASLAVNYKNNLNNPSAALDYYRQTIDLCFELTNRMGSTPVGCTIDAAALLRQEGKYDEAMVLLQRYDNAMIETLIPVWRIKLLRAFAEVYLGQGQEDKAKECYDKISQLEGIATP